MALLGKIQAAKAGVTSREGDRTPLERMFWRSIAIVAGFSMVINMLNMVIPLYSMQVFDRVLSSRSVDTLFLLTVGIGIVLIFLAAMQQLRSRVLVRIGMALDLGLGGDLFAHVVHQASRTGGAGLRQRPLRDLYSLRGFLTGSGPLTLIDFMWAPVYIGVVFIFDVRLGLVALGGAATLVLLAVATEMAAKISVDRSEQSQNRGIAQEETYVRNAEAMEAMGMTPAARLRWQADQSDALYWESQTSRRVGTSTTLSHFVRLAMQVAFIGTGAYLVLQESITIGIMVASMIMGMRGLAPFDGAVNAWRSWRGAHRSFDRLNRILLEKKPELPAPTPVNRGLSVSVDRLVFAPPGSRNVLFKGFSFKAAPGQIISIAGFNGVGKTALLKLIMGVWVPGSGSVKLDDVEAGRIYRGEIGPQIGYLAQNPFLFPGTIAENIARLGDAQVRDIVQAAELAGAHKFILDLPDGYDTRVDRGGTNLSGGQRQLVALAAALFGRPRLLLLDEPTTALDDGGVAHISKLIEIVRRAGVTTFIVSHERELLKRADAIIALANGQIQMVPVRASSGGQKAMAAPSPTPQQPKPAVATAASQPSSDGPMRIATARVAVPNPDFPRHPDKAAGPADEGAKYEPRPTPGGTMMTMRPVAAKAAASGRGKKTAPGGVGQVGQEKQTLSHRKTARAAAKQAAIGEAGSTTARQRRAQRPAEGQEAVQSRPARKTAADPAQGPRPQRQRPSGADGASNPPRRRATDVPPRPEPGERPQLRVVEGSGRRREGGA